MSIRETNQIISSTPGVYAPKTKTPGPSPKEDFATYLREALGDVNELQQKADQSIRQLVGENKGDLQDTLVALEKADLSFRLMMQVRNKILDAYQEILRMQL